MTRGRATGVERARLLALRDERRRMEGTSKKLQTENRFSVSPRGWRPGEMMPVKYTGEGDDVSPPLDFANVPSQAQTLAIVMEDLDAPSGNFTHWLIWNLPAETKRLPEGAEIQRMGGRGGRNDFGSVGYRGPKPPDAEEHRYVLTVYAVRGALPLPDGVTRDRVEAELDGHVEAMGETVVSYRGSG